MPAPGPEAMPYLRAVLDLRGLGSTDKLTLFALVLHSDGVPWSFHAFSRITGLTRNTLKRCMPRLIDLGYVDLLEPSRVEGRTNLPAKYRVRFERLRTSQQEART